MAGFTLFADFFEQIDQASASYGNDMIANMVSAITGPVTVGLTIAFIALGVGVMLGRVGMGPSEFLAKSFKSAIIVSIALTGGLYQGQIAQTIRTLPDDMTSALVSNQALSQGGGNMIDHAAETGFRKAGEAWEQAGFMTGEGWAYGGAGLIMILATVIMVVVGGAFMAIAKVILGLLVGVGPFFIVMMLFKSTSQFFDKWAATGVACVLLSVFLAAVFGFMLAMFDNYVSSFAMDGNQNVVMSLGGMLIIAGITALILLSLPGLAQGLSGGFSTSGIGEAGQAGRLAAGAGQAAGGAAGAVSGFAQGIGGGIGRVWNGLQSLGGGSGGGGQSEGGQAAQGHARGKKAA